MRRNPLQRRKGVGKVQWPLGGSTELQLAAPFERHDERRKKTAENSLNSTNNSEASDVVTKSISCRPANKRKGERAKLLLVWFARVIPTTILFVCSLSPAACTWFKSNQSNFLCFQTNKACELHFGAKFGLTRHRPSFDYVATAHLHDTWPSPIWSELSFKLRSNGRSRVYLKLSPRILLISLPSSVTIWCDSRRPIDAKHVGEHRSLQFVLSIKLMQRHLKHSNSFFFERSNFENLK